MQLTPRQQYARWLSALEGTAFQNEVTTRLASVLLGFQTIPSKPLGDGGLDGLSHGGTVAYCCYGLEHDAFKTNHQRERALVRKFTADLRRLFELRSQSGTLTHEDTAELSTILASHRRLRHIKLIANWFESHRVLSPIATKVAEYQIASRNRYVHPDVEVVIQGPDAFSRLHPIDELTLLRVSHGSLIQRVHAVANAIEVGDLTTFDAKIHLLRRFRPDQASTVNALADSWRSAWRTALAFEQELDDVAPNLHLALEEGRREILTEIATLMLSSASQKTPVSSGILRRIHGSWT